MVANENQSELHVFFKFSLIIIYSGIVTVVIHSLSSICGLVFSVAVMVLYNKY